MILHLDIAQEERQLSPEEHDLRARLKRRVISLVVLVKDHKKQCARVSNVKEEDADTKLFHHRVNARRRKNHIQRIMDDHGWITKHDAKEKIIADHFSNVMMKGCRGTKDFDWEELNVESHGLHNLDSPITEKC